MQEPESLPRALKEEYAPPKWVDWKASNLVSGEAPEQPVDIIFVQGLASSYEWTWKATLEDGRDVMWLRDLLPDDLPEARILTFEYDSKWMQTSTNKAAFVTLQTCGQRLLQSIIWDRTHSTDGEMCPTMKQRPIILVGHSYGGLVIKSALVQAAFTNNQENYYDDCQAFITSVAGVIYLGTPHGGSRFARFGLRQTMVSTIFGRPSNPNILEPLVQGPKSFELTELERAFARIRKFEQLKRLQTFYFYETKCARIAGINFELVVDKESACLGAEHGCEAALGTDHINLNKFKCREDENYMLVTDRLKSIFRLGKNVVKERWGKSKYDDRSAGPELIELNRWLEPCQLAMHISKLQKGRAKKTCEWVINEDALMRWSDPTCVSSSDCHNQTYFIHGKAGSGKSTLAVFIRDWLEDRLQSTSTGAICPGIGGSPTCITRGEALLFFSFFGNRNLVPAIGTLTHQLLQQHSENKKILQIATKFQQANSDLSPEAAMGLLGRLTSVLSVTYIVIDGLDECDDRKLLIELLEGLCQSSRIRLLVLARKELIIEESTKDLFRFEDMVLDIASKNGEDIRSFVKERVQRLVEERPALAEMQDDIEKKINGDSRGMFQWAKLMIDALQYCQEGADDVLQVLEGFPRDLNGAYRKTFDRLIAIPNFDTACARNILKLLVSAARPLTLQELGMAIEIHKLLKNGSNGLRTAVEVCSRKVLSRSDAQLRRRFEKTLSTLVEFSQSTKGPGHTTIHICHHSLTQLLQSEPQLLISENPSQLNSWREFSFTAAAAHEFAAQCCFQALCSGGSLRTCLEGYYDGSTLTPFLGYALNNWVFHLQASGIPLETPHNLIGWVEELVCTSLNFSMFTMAGVSEILQRIDFDIFYDLMHLVAFRDLQTRLQLAVEATSKILSVLPSLAVEIQRARLSGAQSRQGPTIRRRVTFSPEGADIAAKTGAAYGALLDSPPVAEVFTLIAEEPDILNPLTSHLELLRDASRKLRRLTVALSVDPIRAWLYHHVGNEGVFPIPLLAQATHTLDVFISCPVLPLLRSETNIFKRQFEVDRTHPLFGHFFSARLELDVPRSPALSQAFYKRHIIDQYRPRLGEWAAIHLSVSIIEASLSWRRDLMTTVLDLWMFRVLKYDPPHPGIRGVAYALPSEKIGRLKARSFTMNPAGASDGLWLMPSLLIFWLVRIVITARPKLEELLSNISNQILINWGMLPLCLESLFRHWRYTPVAFTLYALRLKYVPWLFTSFKGSPWIDLSGIYNDPFSYQSTIEIRSWKMFLLIISHESIVHVVLMWLFTSIPQFDLSHPSLVSRSFGSIQTSTTLKEKIRPHLERIGIVFCCLICLERTLYEMSYILFDMIYASIRLWQPEAWSWTTFLIINTSILGRVLGRQLGSLVAPTFLILVWISIKLWKLTGIGYFIGIICSHTIAPVMYRIWWLLSFPSAFIARCFNWGVLIITALILKLGPKSLILLVISPVLLLFGVVGLAAMDPLRLGRAARLCRSAGRTARAAYLARSVDHRPILEQLKWRATDDAGGKEALQKALMNLDEISQIVDGAELDDADLLLNQAIHNQLFLGNTGS